MEIEELNKLTQEYMWIKEIAESHTKLIGIIEREKGNFMIKTIGNGDAFYDVNPFYPIPDEYLIDGLKASIENCQNRMKEIEVLCKNGKMTPSGKRVAQHHEGYILIFDDPSTNNIYKEPRPHVAENGFIFKTKRDAERDNPMGRPIVKIEWNDTDSTKKA